MEVFGMAYFKHLPQSDLAFLFTSEAAFIIKKEPDNVTEIKTKKRGGKKNAEA